MVLTEAGQKVFVKLFEKEGFFNVSGLTATPEKMYRSFKRLQLPVRINLLVEKEQTKEHVLMVKLVNEKGNFVGFVGENRFKEILNEYIKPSLVSPIY